MIVFTISGHPASAPPQALTTLVTVEGDCIRGVLTDPPPQALDAQPFPPEVLREHRHVSTMHKILCEEVVASRLTDVERAIEGAHAQVASVGFADDVIVVDGTSVAVDVIDYHGLVFAFAHDYFRWPFGVFRTRDCGATWPELLTVDTTAHTSAG